MSSRARIHVGIQGTMFMAVGYDADGEVIASRGPYSTAGAAAGVRGRLHRYVRGPADQGGYVDLVVATDVLESIVVEWRPTGSHFRGK